jgi:hypothetical protein
MNPWVELLIEVKEMRDRQKAYFKNKDTSQTKKLVAFSKLCEMKVDQLITKLEKSCTEKQIDLTPKKPIEDEYTD